MLRKKFLSIRYKLVLLLSLSALVAILLSSIAIFFYALEKKQTQNINNLAQLTEILAENLTAPIEFDDDASAATLLKSLKLNQNIQGAFLYKNKDEVFASYEKQISLKESMQEKISRLYTKNSMNKRFEDVDSSYIIINVPIILEEEFIASFIIVSDTKEIIKSIKEQMITQLVVAFITILIVVFIAFRLQKIFTLPIFALRNTMIEVSQKNDYTLRVSDKRDDEFQDLFDGFNSMIDTIGTKNEQLNSYTQKISSLLNNAGQGFLSIGADLIIDDEYSKECISLLGDDLSSRDIADILLKTNHERELFRETIADAIGAKNDEMLQECILSLLPTEIILDRKTLKIEYKMIENEKIMLIITNITAHKKLENKIKTEQETLKMIVEIVSDSEMFFDTKREYEEFINSLESHVNNKKTPLSNVNEIYRIIHTFKGAFAQLYMQKVAHVLHDVESSLSLMIQESKITNENLLKLLKESDFKTSLTQEVETIREILGDEFLKESSYVKINFECLYELQEKVASYLAQEDVSTLEYKELFERILNLSKIKLINLLRPYNNLVNQLAVRLDKEIYPFEVIGDSNINITQEYKPFIKSLIHVFRNSIDHGIEDSETRVENVKDEKGTIQCSFEKKDDALYILISDDGAGISKEKLLQKAEELNLEVPKNIYELIFHDRFSTKNEITDISGRGVGMSAVKSELELLGGKVEINSEIGVGTTFVFTLPYEDR